MIFLKQRIRLLGNNILTNTQANLYYSIRCVTRVLHTIYIIHLFIKV